VEEAADAQAALLSFERGGGFDLLFTDIVLPGRISGVDLARAVRERKPNVGVLLTSGYTKPAQYQVQINELGLTVLVKPYRKTTLAKHVRETLDQGKPTAK
ncbi:MAG TPA: response regulator, partial [Verrucomicrobiae bacterium]|nr:response regulator [Verrucomicrobiae bacterium]